MHLLEIKLDTRFKADIFKSYNGSENGNPNLLDIIRMVCHIYNMTFQEIEKRLKADGWYFVSAKGSHNQYKHAVKSGKVTVPNHKGAIPIGTARAILKQAGLK